MFKNSKLEELRFENETYIDGNIYMGIVTEVLGGVSSVFVDIGQEKRGLLNITNKQVLKKYKTGKKVLVQITRMPIVNKGPKLTTQLTVVGRYFVLITGKKELNFSNKIENEKERKRLSDFIKEQNLSDLTVIIRTFAKGTSKTKLKKEIDYLSAKIKNIQEKKKTTKLAGIVSEKENLAGLFMREYYDKDYEIIVSEKSFLETIKRDLVFYGFKDANLEYKKDALYSNGIEQNIKKLLKKTVWLKSGAYMFIEHTEAMTVIDINTGKNVGNRKKDVLAEVNMEAAKEIVKQVKQRNIGGIIVIDFIDIKHTKSRDKILDILQKGFKNDKARTLVLGMSKLGLIEISRQKKSFSLLEAFTEECTKCEGTGVCLK